jgi:putative transposase
VQWFKSVTTTRYVRGVKRDGWPPFDGHLWQRRFHDRIVRTEREWARFHDYIDHNPALWADDVFYEP